HREGRPVTPSREGIADDRPLGIAVLVVAGGLGLDGPRLAQIEPHVGHVHDVAGHIAQRPRAEVPEATPRERVIGGAISIDAIKPRRGLAEPEVAVQGAGNGRRSGVLALRPNRSVGPNVYLLDIA